jgi:hypothetical protein
MVRYRSLPCPLVRERFCSSRTFQITTRTYRSGNQHSAGTDEGDERHRLSQGIVPFIRHPERVSIGESPHPSYGHPSPPFLANRSLLTDSTA